MTVSIGASEKSKTSIQENVDIFYVMALTNVTDEILIGSINKFLSTRIADLSFGSDESALRLLTWLKHIFLKHEAAEYHILKAIIKVIEYFPKHRLLILELFYDETLIFKRFEGDNTLLKHEKFAQIVLDCIGAMCNDLQISTLSEEEIKSCKVLMRFLSRMHYWNNFNYSQFPSIIFDSLVLLKKLISLCKDEIQLYLPELLGISMTFVYFGNQIREEKELRPNKLLTSSYYNQYISDAFDSPATNVHIKLCGKVLKQKKCRGNRTKELTSESYQKNANIGFELDTGTVSNFQLSCSKLDLGAQIRINSIYLLGDIVRCVPERVISSYWQFIYPSDIEESINVRSDILLVIETDESSKCRCAALQVCAELFLSSKSLFNQAEYRNRSAAFVPLSQKLGVIIVAAFQSLTLLLKKETSIPSLLQALKCATALVQVTPFVKFECKFIYDFVSVIKKFVSHNDCTVKASALTVIEFLLLEQELPKDAIEALGLLPKLSFDQTVVKKSSTNNFPVNNLQKPLEPNIDLEYSWLILITFYNLGYIQGEMRIQTVQIANLLRIKSFQILSAMATHFELCIKDRLVELAYVLERALNDCQFEIRLCGSKSLNTIVYQMGLNIDKKYDLQGIDRCVSFWVHILPPIMHQIQMEKELPVIKNVLIDAISNIGKIVFENLPQSIQMLLLSFLTGVCSENTKDVIVRATVVRVLSIFATFPSMRINLVFIENTADMLLRLVHVENIMVRIKIFWAMGNISDALLENSDEICNERISDAILWSLIRQATEACSDNDKVRCNAVRVLGNLMRLLSKKHFSKISDRNLIKCAINTLIETLRISGSSKVKWNSCYAIGNLLQNENIYICTNRYEDFTWQEPLYSSLCHTICCHANYKVKINATSALVRVNKRSYFGEFFGIIWKTAIKAVEQTHNLLNFYEYNHRDMLQEQLCLLLCHIINLATPDDYIILSRLLLERVEIVRNTWIRVTRRMIPEKAASLLSTSSLMLEVLERSKLNQDQENAIKLILDAIPLNF